MGIGLRASECTPVGTGSEARIEWWSAILSEVLWKQKQRVNIEPAQVAVVSLEREEKN